MTLIEKLASDPMERVPEHLRGGLRRYIVHGIPPGHFLTAVLEHELFTAMQRGDEASRAGLFDLVCWIYNHAPFACHGNRDAVQGWIAEGGLAGRETA